MRHIFSIITIAFIIISCKSTIEPVVYNRANEEIDKDVSMIIYLLQSDNLTGALEKINSSLSKHPDSIELQSALGWYYIISRDIDRAYEIIDGLYKRNIVNPLILSGLARIYRLKGDYENALRFADLTISSAQFLSIGYLEAGLSYYNQGDYNRAIIYFNRADILEPGNKDIVIFKYFCYLNLNKDMDEIKHLWEQVTRQQPLKDWYFISHAYILYNQNKFEDAKTVVNHGLTEFRGNRYLININNCLLIKEYDISQDQTVLEEAYRSAETIINSDDGTIEAGFYDTFYQICERAGYTDQIAHSVRIIFSRYSNSEEIIGWIEKYYNL